MAEPSRRFRVLLLCVLAVPAWALFGQSRDEAAVRLNGVPLFEVSAAGGESASARALRIERRLERIADRPESAGRPILVTPAPDGSRVIGLEDAAIVTVTRADADDHLVPVDALAAEWAGIIADALDRARAGRRSPWRGLGVEIKGAIATAVSRVGASAGRVLPRVVAALVVLALFWAVAVSIRRLLRALFRRVVSDLTVENLLKQAAYYAVWVVGILVAADALGFEPGTVVAGLGLTSLALGFALKDIISNFVSGMLILGLRPFEIGDEIVVGSTEGMVQQIELRATEIKTYDGRLVLVPNAELFTSRVTNNTASPVRRAAVDLPVGYGTDLDLAGRALLQAAADTAEVLKEPAPSVRIRELGPADIRMELRFWTDSRRADQLATMSAVRGRLVQTFRDAGIALPDPEVRRLRIGKASGEDPSWNS